MADDGVRAEGSDKKGASSHSTVVVGPVYQSRFKAAVPVLPRPLAILCFILNLIPSGWGEEAEVPHMCLFT